MIGLTYMFILRLNRKEVTDGNYVLVVAEFIATLIALVIIRNT